METTENSNTYTAPIVRKDKVCSKCKKEQLIDNFTKQAASPDGRGAYCGACRQKYNETLGSRKYVPTPPSFVPPQPIDFGDLETTKLMQNRNFVSGDGGYSDYINARKEASNG